ncbi:hypothetical protein LTR53_017583 [Teratosphaeriaceae sp. CCFEE 6253]|nr:hypothetical protein LTR53_017583 [Teratosphaeriaceae sp. CCFEE 6253]
MPPKRKSVPGSTSGRIEAQSGQFVHEHPSSSSPENPATARQPAPGSERPAQPATTESPPAGTHRSPTIRDDQDEANRTSSVPGLAERLVQEDDWLKDVPPGLGLDLPVSQLLEAIPDETFRAGVAFLLTRPTYNYDLMDALKDKLYMPKRGGSSSLAKTMMPDRNESDAVTSAGTESPFSGHARPKAYPGAATPAGRVPEGLSEETGKEWSDTDGESASDTQIHKERACGGA